MIWIAVSLVATILSLWAFLDTRKPKKFPPGPAWYPVVGSAHQLLRARTQLGSLYEATAALSKRYGPVMGFKAGVRTIKVQVFLKSCFQVGKDPIVVVYGPQETKEMELSEDLIGRPIDPYFKLRTWNKRRGDSVDQGRTVVELGVVLGVLLTDNKFWQEQKRFLLRHLKEFGFGTKNMSVLIEQEVGHLLEFIEKSIDENQGSVVFKMESMFSMSVLNTVWCMLAGVRYSQEDQKMKSLQSIMFRMFKTIHMVGAAFSHFPILKYLAPQLSGYKCYMETHQQIWDFLRDELDAHKKTHVPHHPRDLMDVYLDVLRSPDHSESFSEEQLLAISMDMFMAGSETTSNTISFTFLYLMLNERVQKMAQKEIDAVLAGRPPSLQDRTNMPYMEAIVLEGLRMFGGRAFTVPHRALRDTNLGGYIIPKVSFFGLVASFCGKSPGFVFQDVLVVANLHGSMMGPDSGFENPDEFIPERYLKNGKVVQVENHLPFGLGKRRCMGESMARANIFLFTAGLLQRYDVGLVPDSPPDMKTVEGVTPSVHYKSRITRRSAPQ
ncbi:probable cytochrome P450 303a1 [Dendroctonus ponderosae]|uniref:probable cytochrome P450 303a1 n=1 Tax=Dendroctonus ponderosae TaxID=77166 RepID=UPI0020357E36|nr:probable cytochrome P450 303a1 [Dendroctonus ponderosae]